MIPVHRVRVGVVGCGYWGTFHAEKYAALSSCFLAGVADAKLERAQALAARIGTKPYSDYRDLIPEVDAASIVVPAPLHYAVARDFLRAGKHILVEKPMALSLQEADHLNEMAEKRGLVLQIGHIERFNPAVRAMEEEVGIARFIESHRLAVFKERGTDVDVLLDLMIHDLDLALRVVGRPVIHVEALGIPVLTDKVDIANARLRFENGAVANITASRASISPMRKFRVFHDGGYVSLDLHDQSGTIVRRIQEKEGSSLSASAIPPGDEDLLKEEIGSFLSAVSRGERPAISGKEGREALAAALQVARKIDEELVGMKSGGEKENR